MKCALPVVLITTIVLLTNSSPAADGYREKTITLDIPAVADSAGGILVADVDDDGRGFDTSTMAPTMGSGLGLVGLGERVTSVGGTVDIDSRLGEGTTITVAIPTPFTLVESTDRPVA